jgi:hypothetical protein
MTMDPRKYLVIIKGKDHTDDVLRIAPEADRMVVTYKNGKSYRYARRNVECLTKPQRITVDNQRLTLSGNMLSDVKEVLRFGNYAKVFHGTGGTRCCPLTELATQRMTSPSGRSKDILAYFRELAEAISLRTSENESLLAMKYRQLNIVSHRSILSSFLKAPSLSSELSPSFLTSSPIFPFGCNMSQKTAVHRAIQHPISLVQGPPGTGKTLTILNLIGNMLLQKKRVAVVSNNNSATANVLQKLQKYELDFVTAFLGSAQNKQAFIEGQTGEAVCMPRLQVNQEASLHREILELNQDLDKAFETKNALAATIQEIDALRLELTHFENYHKETKDPDANEKDKASRLSKIPARKLLNAWLAYEQKAKRISKTTLPLTKGTSYQAGLIEKIRLFFRFGMAGIIFFTLSIEERIPLLQQAFYLRKLADLENKEKRLEVSLSGFRFDERLERLTEFSMQLLKHRLADHYNNRARRIFDLEDLWKQPDEFLDEYPVVLSTTFSIITSVKNGYLFDCVIVDEASQVDLLNGVLAMGCAEKLVIVGDPMQLPNVLAEQDASIARQVASKYEVPEHARFERHNLLSAVRAAFPEIPETLLREHYRCHPKIIQFCNQKFYGGDLLLMTRDQGEPDVLKAYVTVAGRHARGTFNQRQIDEVVQNVLPELGPIDPNEIGIVSPYREQTARMQASIDSKAIEIDTVHKYQGRESAL